MNISVLGEKHQIWGGFFSNYALPPEAIENMYLDNTLDWISALYIGEYASW
jgi:hypothetical protein